MFWFNVHNLQLLCSDSMFTTKRVGDGSFSFLWKTLVFFFLHFLNLGAQIRCPQNQYTNHLMPQIISRSVPALHLEIQEKKQSFTHVEILQNTVWQNQDLPRNSMWFFLTPRNYLTPGISTCFFPSIIPSCLLGTLFRFFMECEPSLSNQTTPHCHALGCTVSFFLVNIFKAAMCSFLSSLYLVFLL